MHKEGIEVSLRLTDCDAYIREHQNPASKPRKSGCYARSSLISAATGTGFVVEIKFRERFVDNYNLMVIIHCGPSEGPIEQHSNYQAWYIPRGTKETKYEFLSFDVWEDASLPLKEVAMAMPPPDDCDEEAMGDMVWTEAMSANAGCISVFIVRGKLDLNHQAENRALTEPPLRPREITDLAVINQEWFDPSTRGGVVPHAFEFRNLGQERLADIQTTRTGSADRGSRNAPQRLNQPSHFSRRSRPGQARKRSNYGDEEQPPTKRTSQRLYRNAENTKSRCQGQSPGSDQVRMNGEESAGEDEDDEEVSRAQPKEEEQETPVPPEPSIEQASASATIEQNQQTGPAIPPFTSYLLVNEASITASATCAPSDRPSIESSSTLKMQEASGDSDDEEDLEDELRQLEIKRKLRAINKIQEGSGDDDDREDLEDEMRQLEIKRNLRALRKIRKATETKGKT